MSLIFSLSSSAQTIPENQYGLPVVETKALYDQLVLTDPNQSLVDLKVLIPGIRLDIRYATTRNFTHRRLYTIARAYLRLPAAKALLAVGEELKSRGLGLCIFDAYRPYSVTEKMWETLPDNRYAANPRHGSQHNRGVAVDLTLVDLHSGKPLAMPSDFDDFTEKAHRDYRALPDSVITNRTLLENVMTKHGFVPLSTEWWHFYYQGKEEFPLMNIGFDELKAGS